MPTNFKTLKEIEKNKKISLSVTGFEPAISRFVAERVIRCATRMCCRIVKKMGIRISCCFVLYFFPRKLRSNCGALAPPGYSCYVHYRAGQLIWDGSSCSSYSVLARYPLVTIGLINWDRALYLILKVRWFRNGFLMSLISSKKKERKQVS